MDKLHSLDHSSKVLWGATVVGILCLALTGTAWGRTPAGSSQQQQPVPAVSESGEQPGFPAAMKSTDDAYIIGNSDLLEISVWKNAELTESVPVRSDGKISMPLIGEIQASGRTPIQLKNEITTRLRAYLTAPEVIVIVQQMNSQKFNILGRVLRPGSYPLLATTTVLDAIAVGGGFQDFAKQKEVYILRHTADRGEVRIPFNYKAVIRGSHPDENIKLLPNDTVVVP